MIEALIKIGDELSMNFWQGSLHSVKDSKAVWREGKQESIF